VLAGRSEEDRIRLLVELPDSLFLDSAGHIHDSLPNAERSVLEIAQSDWSAERTKHLIDKMGVAPGDATAIVEKELRDAIAAAKTGRQTDY
jgi:hypothetical protein